MNHSWLYFLVAFCLVSRLSATAITNPYLSALQRFSLAQARLIAVSSGRIITSAKPELTTSPTCECHCPTIDPNEATPTSAQMPETDEEASKDPERLRSSGRTFSSGG